MLDILQPSISIILCTHNPRAEYINKALRAIESQQPTLGDATWELIIVDNASRPALEDRPEIGLPLGSRVIIEPKLGLTHARRRGFEESTGEVIVYVDDDNLLQPDYLRNAWQLLQEDQRLAAIGGRSLAVYETAPPAWFGDAGISLACRDLGPAPIEANWRNGMVSSDVYPKCAPIGAGMVLRRSAYAGYIREVDGDQLRMALGRRGADLASGEDNDMVLTMLGEGWSVAYRPELVLSHLIPAARLELAYLKRYAYSSNRTWVQVLAVHGICPWPSIVPLTAPLRKARLRFRIRPGRGPLEAIAYAGACGQIDGRTVLGRMISAKRTRRMSGLVDPASGGEEATPSQQASQVEKGLL
jgi:glycosyltransferase involved in cell wall biosynthesis